jgi:DNA polymerase-3 subunit gamma/tau
MAVALAVKYRPRELEEIVEQKSIIRILEKQLQLNQIKNCYLFCGPSGCGKTTTARAFAYKINGGVGEPIEIDGASNSGVDNVRTIIKNAQERSIEGKYKIFIIDECHALSNAAWQAFLKCLEEPPTYTIFMFCTTDPQKIPATILNRVMRFNVTKISTPNIIERLKYICRCENLSFTDEAIEYIAKLSDGGMRDAIANLEKCVDYGEIEINNVLSCLGSYSHSMFFELVNSIIDGVDNRVIEIIEDIYNSGSDLKLFVDHFLNFSLDVAKYSIFNNCDLVKIPSSMEPDLKNATAIENASQYYMYLVNRILELKQMVKTDTNVKDTVEVMILKMCRYM